MADLQTSIFRVAIPEQALTDLRKRLAQVRWPEQPEGAGWEAGTDLSYLKSLTDYWREGFDWRAQEARLNGFAQFTADVGGHTIHFIHKRARATFGIPLILTHGWPGSFVEMLKILPLLTDPANHGAPQAPAFHVVVPSLPGYGFSSRPLHTGVDCAAIADLWVQLMEGLGYPRFGAQGGDWGAGITFRLGQRHPRRMLGLHFNTLPATLSGAVDFTPDEKAALARWAKWEADENGYGHMQRTKPQTLTYGLTDSPVGLAAWILEKFRSWSDCGGDLESAFSRDELLTNLSVYWFTATIGSSMRIYREALAHPNQLAPGETIGVPAGMACFPAETDNPPRSYMERMFSDLRRWSEMPRGGHFAAMEQPQLLAEEIRAFFGGLA